MNIALIGYGKMGREIEAIALDRGHQISLKVTRENADFTPGDLAGTDVAIEFSRPEAAVNNIQKCVSAGVPVVVGTTGWYDEFDAVVQQVNDNKGCLFYASNFSLGVNIFFKVNEYLAEIMNRYPEYQVSMEEIHHTQKLDAPSGTAITAAEKILGQIDRKESWKLDESEEDKDLVITAKRLPEVPGTHEVFYSSSIDTLSFKHEAHNRKGFALGSVLAAEFCHGKTGVYNMNNLLGL
ncbi:4-hydroxy-tetrahydrodipicolinate reductase [bacterium SCSIO 12741]|nr:4-hydroxy-tetrahydrodipicolinate reductase [bacterium SCSIO 12741]